MSLLIRTKQGLLRQPCPEFRLLFYSCATSTRGRLNIGEGGLRRLTLFY